MKLMHSNYFDILSDFKIIIALTLHFPTIMLMLRLLDKNVTASMTMIWNVSVRISLIRACKYELFKGLEMNSYRLFKIKGNLIVVVIAMFFIEYAEYFNCTYLLRI
ncbi:hypothetical protein C1O35_01575 [Staphylococcus schleiferi]|uniref:Uncharacterized protein n=1 Tax=Staphylococcus schleiferi TaxID=1295 RepID=A0ABX0G0X1_STASC|nr:hypothetical protein [Staphylococcus schleiferi]NHA37747.1 hypothetical protein [Staphylococcus schleiferi]NHA40299.1 hypothetical protein [Staphylococcus schleiferi]NHA43431.1 hypothetical protein [Staphylococcus schleiferi]